VPGAAAIRSRPSGEGDRCVTRAATLATYAPGRDLDARTLRLALSLIELLADCARGQ
jgi:hypothetical protein